ncbi:N(2)-fixation sustaining protein CowN [Vibrio diazotrophicus]|uniref:N(2)-fixation sustaining protein CowN n=1 Tax=Vibrio diazotrophicus TaxID=685 RepID=UPI0034C67287
MGRDNLNVVENPLNVLYSYFEECDDTDALELLYMSEQGCCKLPKRERPYCVGFSLSLTFCAYASLETSTETLNA